VRAGSSSPPSVALVFFFVLVPVVVILVVVLILVPIVVLVVFLFLFLVLTFFFFIVIAGPAFRLIDLVEIEFLPGIEIDLLDVTIQVLDLDQLRILVHREHSEALVLFYVLIPLSRDGLVFSGHRLQSSKLGRREGASGGY